MFLRYLHQLVCPLKPPPGLSLISEIPSLCPEALPCPVESRILKSPSLFSLIFISLLRPLFLEVKGYGVLELLSNTFSSKERVILYQEDNL